MRDKLIQNGVNNLKEFGYPNANTENILTDLIYASMFKSMLNDNIGHRPDLDLVIEKLLIDIEDNCI